MKFLKYFGYLLAFVAVLAIAGIIYIKTALPNVGEPEDIKINVSAERIEHGKYLANHVSLCVDCHSTRDWTKFAGPLVKGTEGKGGEVFDEKFGFPGTFYAPNITQEKLASWTDGEILRAVTTGVSKDGRALFPIMPHPSFGQMDKNDVIDMIAYIKTLPAIKHDVPASKPSFPMNIIIHTIPKVATFSKKPDTSNAVEYGKYLFTAASCSDCHTKMDKGEYIMDMYLAGGNEFKTPMGLIRPANITPDMETGIGKWTEEYFVKRFEQYQDSATANTIVKKGEFNTIMPWTMYGHMTRKDLTSIYAYLRTVKPIKNKVEKFSKL